MAARLRPGTAWLQPGKPAPLDWNLGSVSLVVRGIISNGTVGPGWSQAVPGVALIRPIFYSSHFRPKEALGFKSPRDFHIRKEAIPKPVASKLLFTDSMRWFCAGHFVATWLVCTSLLVRFHSAHDSSVPFILLSVILWPVVLWALPLKGYFYLKAVTLDRLKARVHRGELKKMVVFFFGFATSILAALSIGLATWAFSAMDTWFSQQDGALSLAHTIAWFPIAFCLWVVIPTVGMATLGRGSEVEVAEVDPAGS